MSDTPPFPWIFPYIEEPVGDPMRRGQFVYRPIIEAQLVGPLAATPKVFALDDSGAEDTYASFWIPQAIGISDRLSAPYRVGIAGANRRERFADVAIRIFPVPAMRDEVFYEWEAEVGFFEQWEPPYGVILGQLGFFQHFTVTMHRPALVIESPDTFDDRFQVHPTTDEERPR